MSKIMITIRSDNVGNVNKLSQKGRKKSETGKTVGVLKNTHKKIKNTKKVKQNAFLITQNKTERKFSRESVSSKPLTIQKQTDNLADAGWVLPEECVHETTGIN